MVIIESLKTEDIPALLKLYKQLAPPYIEFNTSLDHGRTAYEHMLREQNSMIAVAKENGEIVGSALGICCQCLMGTFLVVEDVIVREDQRGKGVGHMLMDALDTFAKEQECAYAFLVSSNFRTQAHRFYEKIGYTDGVVGFRKLYTKHTDESTQK